MKRLSRRAPQEDEARSLEQALAYAETQAKQDEVKPQTVAAAKKLLGGLVRRMENVPYDAEQVQILLELLVMDTEFQNAGIYNRGEAEHGFLEKNPAYSGLIEMLATIPAYNIWFERTNGEWSLNFNKVPDGGNWRG